MAHIPQIDFSQINIIREKYDPNFSFIDPHITIVFPLDASIGEQSLMQHIESVTLALQPFTITLSGLEKSWDHYLHLSVQEGEEKIISLHDSLYTGMLAPFWLKDIPYIPHVTLGFFANQQAKFDKSDLEQVVFNESSYTEALNTANLLNMKYQVNFNSLALISREDKNSKAVIVKEFQLKG